MPGATFRLADAFAAFGVQVSDGVMTANGSNPRILTSPTAAFQSTDVGKRIIVAGAGLSGADLDTRITRVISATKVELKNAALTTVGSADLSYAIGVYRLSNVLAGPDIDGNRYEVDVVRALQIQLAQESPGGVLWIGGPFVTNENYGIRLEGSDNTRSSPNTIGLPLTTGDYLVTDTPEQLINIYWIDDYNRATSA